MNILLLGAFGKGALENYYVNGLQQQGASILTWDIADPYYTRINKSVFHKAINKVRPAVFYKPVNDSLLQFMKGKQFDVILVFKGLALFPDTIRELKKYTRLLCCYNPDHPFKFFSEGSGNKNIEDSIRLYDVYYTYAERIMNDLKGIYSVDAYTIPFGYDDSVTESATIRPQEFEDKWLFIGAYDEERAAFVDELGNEELFIYGDAKWGTRTGNSHLIQKVYQKRALYDDEYKAAIRYGMGVFNVLRRQNIEEGSHNMRTFEVPGYGGLLIANRTPEQLAFFEEEKEAVYFESIPELKEKLQWLQNDKKQIEKIKLAARNRAQRSGYGYTARSKELYKHWSDYL